MSAETDDLELIDTLQELRSSYGVRTTYQRLWAAIVNGQVPAHRDGRRWKMHRSDLPKAVAALGATLPTAA